MKIALGAEAEIILESGSVIKDRIQKSYRIPEIDLKLRRERTRREAKMLKALPVPSPRLIESGEFSLTMEELKGKKLALVLENLDYTRICREVGEGIRRLHDKGIIHGDLTTSNMIFSDKVYFIDFGLSFQSHSLEDKAVDLHLLSQALESKHHSICKECFEQVLESYGDKNVIGRLKMVEARGRNK
jgi:TP53 regulating kinase-like protein